MALQGEVKTFYMDEKQERIAYPVTITKAITDENGIKLDEKIENLETVIKEKSDEIDTKLQTLGTQCIFRLEGTILYIDPIE